MPRPEDRKDLKRKDKCVVDNERGITGNEDQPGTPLGHST